MKYDNLNHAKGALASLPPESVDQLCDLIISKLEERTVRVLASQAEGRGFEPRLPLQLLASKQHYSQMSYSHNLWFA